MVRPYYIREAGGYVMPDPATTPTALVPSALKESGAGGATAADEALRKAAEVYLGVPYLFGGQSRSGMDCSGFIRQVFADTYGMDLPHSSAAIFGRGQTVARVNLKIGDLVFFKSLGFIDHAGIYMGGGTFIDAGDYGEVITIRPIYDNDYFIVRLGI